MLSLQEHCKQHLTVWDSAFELNGCNGWNLEQFTEDQQIDAADVFQSCLSSVGGRETVYAEDWWLSIASMSCQIMK